MGEMHISRRTFGKIAGLSGAAAMMGATLSVPEAEAVTEVVYRGAYPEPVAKKPEAFVDPKTGEVTINEEVVTRYSACLGCYNCCGNRVSIDRATGDVMSIGGNPYNATCTNHYLDFDAPLKDAFLGQSFTRGAGNNSACLCERGLGTWDMYSRADRITSPLKRAGKRGEGKWETISWDQLIKEVTEGGKLFAHLGEDQDVVGLKALHDNETLIDPNRPDLGPISNQLVELGGRGDGRSIIAERFVEAFGSKNQYYHAATCGGALMYSPSRSSNFSIRADLDHSEFVIWCGTFPGTTGNAANGGAKRCVDALCDGRAKMVVFDPLLSSGIVTPTQGNAKWYPIKPATNPAFAMGLLQWIIGNEAYAADYLTAPNIEASRALGYNSISNATHLVICDEDHPNYRKMMRPEDAGLEVPAEALAEDGPACFVVIDAATGNPSPSLSVSEGQLEFEGEVNGVKVRTAFMYVKDAAFEKSLDDWAQITQVPREVIEETAREFTSHGPRAAIAGMGATVNMNGLDCASMYDVLNSMIGSANMKGGACPRPCSPGTGDGERYLLGTIEGAPSTKFVPLSRSGKNFVDSDEYRQRKEAGEENPLPELPWYFIPRNTDNQAMTGLVHQYPYQAKILITWMFNSIQSSPGANRETFIEALKNPEVVPLHIACDVFMGTFASLADYYVPDTTPYESFAVFESQGLWEGYSDTVRWPVTEPKSDMIDATRHASFEAFLADVGRVCELPGFGDKAMQAADGTWYPLNDACDYFLKAVANVAYDREPVADVDADEIHLQALDTLPAAWKAAVTPEEWPKVLKVLSRGGRCLPIEDMFDDQGRHLFGSDYMANLYSEKRASAIYSFTGEHSHGEMRGNPERFADLTPMEEMYPPEEWPFKSVSYKPRFRSVTMQGNSPIMRDLCGTNYIEMNGDDAAELGIVDGDEVIALNPSGDETRGIAMVRSGVARGTFGVAFGYGAPALGAADFMIDTTLYVGDPAIGAGTHLHTMLDPTVKSGNCPVADPEAGVPGRSGGVYQIMKA